MSRRFTFSSLLLLSLITSLSSCVLPVFRYALERWQPESYAVMIFYKDSLKSTDSVQTRAIEQLRNPSHFANIEVFYVNVNAMDSSFMPIWDQIKTDDLPIASIIFPYLLGITKPIWTGKLDPLTIKKYTDSPARKEVSKRLRSGESSVWVMVESGNKKADRDAKKLIEREFRKLEKKLKLSKITDENRPSWFNPDAGPALKIKFSIVTVSREDIAEKEFVSLLLKGNEALLTENTQDALFFPIFGQGRALDAVHGDSLNPENIESLCSFIIGECSCTVKEQNPGFDLLMSEDWSDLIQRPLYVPDTLPQLTGIGAFVSAQKDSVSQDSTTLKNNDTGFVKTSIDDTSTKISKVEPANTLNEKEGNGAKVNGTSKYIVLGSILGLIVIVGLLTFAILRKKK